MQKIKNFMLYTILEADQDRMAAGQLQHGQGQVINLNEDGQIANDAHNILGDELPDEGMALDEEGLGKFLEDQKGLADADSAAEDKALTDAIKESSRVAVEKDLAMLLSQDPDLLKENNWVYVE